MQKEQDEKHSIPVIDCPCGQKDVPLSTIGPYVPSDTSPLKEVYESKGEECEIWVSFCPFCERVPYDESEIKGYISFEELEVMGWQKADEDEEKRVYEKHEQGRIKGKTS